MAAGRASPSPVVARAAGDNLGRACCVVLGVVCRLGVVSSVGTQGGSGRQEVQAGAGGSWAVCCVVLGVVCRLGVVPAPALAPAGLGFTFVIYICKRVAAGGFPRQVLRGSSPLPGAVGCRGLQG